MKVDKESYKKELEKQMRRAEVEQARRMAKEREMNLLEPGEDPGEGYEGTPDMYPDYEEDEKDQKLGRTSTKEFKAIQKMMDKKSTGGSILVKTKLGRTKPTKIY
jgi:hypothetical protein